GTFLRGMEFVHLVCGNHQRLVSCQIERLPRREGVCPVSRTDVVAGSFRKTSGSSQKSVENAESCPLLVPAQNKWDVVRVRESTATADVAVDIRGEIIFGDREGCKCGIMCSSQEFLISDPDQRIHVHQDGVAATDRQSGAVIVPRLMARV